MNKLLVTKRRVLSVTEKENGCLLITDNDGKEIDNAGAFILSLGGKDKILARCVTAERAKELKELKDKRRREEKIREEEEKAELKEDFEKLTSENDTIETNVENLKVILDYFNSMSWGAWPKIKMSIPCKFLQFNCEGQIITAVKLEKKINCDGQMIDKFKINGSVTCLPQYLNINRF